LFVSGSVNMPHKITETAETNGSVVAQKRDGKPEPKDCPVDTRTPVSELKAVNKRVVELQTNTMMGPPSTPAVTPSHKSRNGFSQESPLHIPKIAESTPENDSGWPADPNQPTPKGPFFVSTPQTPYGQALKPNPSPETRKNWKKWIDNFPDFEKERISPKRKRKLSTVRFVIVYILF
jgi:hypothetical protein